MEYLVGSLADVISGSSEPSASKTRIVFVPKTDQSSKRRNEETKVSSSKSTPTERRKIEVGNKVSNEENIDDQSFFKARRGITPKYTSRETQRKHRALKKQKSEATKFRSRTQMLKRGSETFVAESEEAKNRRTIFVKNLPNTMKPRMIAKFFNQYGKIENVRLRCAVPEKPNIKKKIAVIHQKFHPRRSNICAFVCFKSEESVENTLKARNVVLDGHHVFIRQVGKSKREFSKKNALFVGNLPFDVEEDDLYEIFEVCGKIVDITVIRNSQTGMCSGVAYVNFQNSDGVELALQMGEVTCKERQLRISRSGLKAQSVTEPKGGRKVKPKKVHGEKETRIVSSDKRNKTIKKAELKNVGSEVSENGEEASPRNSKNFPKVVGFQGRTVDPIKKKKKKINKEALRKKSIAKMLLSEKKQ